jgi:hypothetical protein
MRLNATFDTSSYVVYLDDACIYNHTLEDHKEHPRLLSQRSKGESLMRVIKVVIAFASAKFNRE